VSSTGAGRQAAEDELFESLLAYIRDHRGFDFTGYKRASLQRRIGKRMQELGIEGYQSYIDQLEASPDEVIELFDTILINVSGFFRDKPVWDYIAAEVIPGLLSDKPADEPIRVWSAGCATGEEPYTIAMLLAEELGEQAYRDRVKIFATDVDAEAVNRARRGIYSAKELEPVPEALRKRYFERVSDGHSFAKDLRRSVIFGVNDLISDAPISRLDLLSCRNTLIYFNSETQSRVMRRLHLALAQGGTLVLGKSELLLTYTEGFEPLDLPLRLFRKVAVRRADDPLHVLAGQMPRPRRREVPDAVLEAFKVSPVAQLVLDADDVVVMGNEPLQVLFGVGDREVGAELKDLEISYRPFELRSLIEEASASQGPVLADNVTWYASDGTEHHLEVEVATLRSDGERTGTSIAFRDVTRRIKMTKELERSKHELENAYEELQSTVEELETTNEELQSTNEELETTNEELQSSNEELETMNEELQSSNEELETMNEELRLRTGELNHATVLVDSMLAGLDVGVAIVDRELAIQMWNDRARELWGVDIDQVHGQRMLNLDIGLPVGRLREALQASVAGVQSGEQRLPARDRRGHDVVCLVRMAPLTDASGVIAGAIVMMEVDDPAEGVEAGPEPQDDRRAAS
jgi:two-component system, chemotaxis family, CheB/CheR fusion protein